VSRLIAGKNALHEDHREMMRPLDLRSDTGSLPTEAMLEAMSAAELRNDMYQEDSSVNRLEALAASMLRKEAGVFVPSGTMGNLIALLTHTQRGDEVILESESHIYRAEVGGICAIGGLMPKRVKGDMGALRPPDVKAAINPRSAQLPRTGLICLENTHNRMGGTVTSPEQTRAVVEVARHHGIPVHLDGARVFHAAVALGIDVGELTADVDSTVISLSKCLCAPVGALLMGSQRFIEQARKIRRMLGGGMHKPGGLAAAGIVALESMVGRLKRDHENARFLAEGLASINGIDIDLKSVQTNIVTFGVSSRLMTGVKLHEGLADRGVHTTLWDRSVIRMITYRGVERDDLQYVLQTVTRVMEEAEGGR
jgi:threonine aldolase